MVFDKTCFEKLALIHHYFFPNSQELFYFSAEEEVLAGAFQYLKKVYKRARQGLLQGQGMIGQEGVD